MWPPTSAFRRNWSQEKNSCGAAGRFFYENYQRQNTYYGLTKTRVIIRQESVPRNTNSIPLTAVTELGTQERKEGRGDIVFNGLPRPSQAHNYQPPRLENIPNFRQVYETVVKLQQGRGTT